MCIFMGKNDTDFTESEHGTIEWEQNIKKCPNTKRVKLNHVIQFPEQ